MSRQFSDLLNVTLACVEPHQCAIRILEKNAKHPQWRGDDTWTTADQAREAIRKEYRDVQFVNRIDFQLAYAIQRKQKS